jgi:hypothetical protein
MMRCKFILYKSAESNPLDSNERFPSSTSDFLLSQVYPGAMRSTGYASAAHMIALTRCSEARSSDKAGQIPSKLSENFNRERVNKNERLSAVGRYAPVCMKRHFKSVLALSLDTMSRSPHNGGHPTGPHQTAYLPFFARTASAFWSTFAFSAALRPGVARMRLILDRISAARQCES